MRIDLPCCGFKNCRYCFDGNCTKPSKLEKCEYWCLLHDESSFNSSGSPNDWIPCSERMPDEHEWLGTKKFGTTISDEVYVTFENPKGERFCRHLSFQNKKLSSYDQNTIDVFYKGSKPIAWMPLPEPYREDTDE